MTDALTFADFEALAARCEQVTLPDRELERDIAEALGWTELKRSRGAPNQSIGFPPNERRSAVVPHWTASVDAALTLVPDDTLTLTYEKAPAGLVSRRHFVEIAEVWHGRAATFALALTAAACRAQAAKQRIGR